jgi:hypothetical protein
MKFQPGHDPRRHTFTPEECAIGGITSYILLVLTAAEAYFDDNDQALNEWLFQQKLRILELRFQQAQRLTGNA